MAHPKQKIQVARTRTRTRASSDPPPRAAPLENHARRIFLRAIPSIRVQTRLRDALIFAFSPFACSIAPPSTPERKKGAKKISRHTAYKKPREQRDREREREHTERAKRGKKKRTRITHVSPSLRSSAVFFRRVAREDCRCREREREIFLLRVVRLERKKLLREGLRHFETLNDNRFFWGGGWGVDLSETPS